MQANGDACRFCCICWKQSLLCMMETIGFADFTHLTVVQRPHILLVHIWEDACILQAPGCVTQKQIPFSCGGELNPGLVFAGASVCSGGFQFCRLHPSGCISPEGYVCCIPSGKVPEELEPRQQPQSCPEHATSAPVRPRVSLQEP